jgi:membrane protein
MSLECSSSWVRKGYDPLLQSWPGGQQGRDERPGGLTRQDLGEGRPAEALGPLEEALQIVNQVVSLVFVTMVFALMYRFLPSVRVAWQDVWHGALVTGVLFTVGKYAIGMYLGKAGVASGFGAAGSIVVLLVWVYFSAQIFLLGAEFTWVYAHQLGSLRARPRTEVSSERTAAGLPATEGEGAKAVGRPHVLTR